MVRRLVIGLVVLGLAGCGGGDDGGGGDGGGGSGGEVKNPTAGPDQIAGSEGDDRILETEDDAIDEIACGEGEDRVLKPDARDRLDASCETVGWTSKPLSEALYENEITVTPVISPGSAQFTATCLEADCTGDLELRTPDQRKPLGKGSFNLAKGQEGQIVVTLDARGARLVQRSGLVRVVIRSGGVNSGFTTFFAKAAAGPVG